jgi:hypothetical protein
MLAVLAMTLSTFLNTTPGLQVGPLHINETFAQVRQILGPAPIVRKIYGDSCPCNSKMTYTDGTSTVEVDDGNDDYGPLSRVPPESRPIRSITILHWKAAGSTRISKTGIQTIERWTWMSMPVFNPSSKTIPGWENKSHGKIIAYLGGANDLTIDGSTKNGVLLSMYTWLYNRRSAFGLEYSVNGG